mgnify:CR=1 FL=1
MTACYSPRYYACGCWLRDVSSHGSKIVVVHCTKHAKEMKEVSWLAWAKKNAPAQYRQYKKDNI